jgi:hypothetical protein
LKTSGEGKKIRCLRVFAFLRLTANCRLSFAGRQQSAENKMPAEDGTWQAFYVASVARLLQAVLVHLHDFGLVVCYLVQELQFLFDVVVFRLFFALSHGFELSVQV